MHSVFNIRILLLLIIGIAYIQGNSIGSIQSKFNDKCDPHEEYKNCGTACPERCDYKPEICTYQCVKGCFCKPNYVRKDNSTNSPCILKKQCPKKSLPLNCGKNKVYNPCGSSCPPSCKDLLYPQKPKFCTLQCVPGCFCKKGLYSTEGGKCVVSKKCCQGQNEEYKNCGTACPERCDYKPGICTQQCVEGCFCKPNYVRKDNSTNSPCILKKQCPKKPPPFKCSTDEVYDPCGSSCPPICQDLLYPQKPKFCTLQCVPGCFCKKGLYRTEGGFVFGRLCLGAHQEYQMCDSACPLTCTDVRHARYFKPCTYQCVQGCFCKRGYTRRSHSRSQCIPDWRC
ncbi:unnamed protein product [Rotaria sordida]|uniref:TIL domain-containing protein n=1 Tax=Rotaria sordida TaxID=392033 RepID=A0A815UYG9_9BILA|nr:unnamed protein product [Rotaria sordida]CAF1370056.1 unnamed protein product [Rotaria sordida]CAF1526138.1 unnamed protein product [Rotaria sordida]CAF4179397.1 unnamed protein product [Rotaria sordida]